VPVDERAIWAGRVDCSVPDTGEWSVPKQEDRRVRRTREVLRRALVELVEERG
jgi:hypothetical protein